MSQRTAGSAPQLYGDQQCHNVEAQRLVSEDHSHYILIKGKAFRYSGCWDTLTAFPVGHI